MAKTNKPKIQDLRIGLVLSKELYAQSFERAKQNGMTFSRFVRCLLEDALKNPEASQHHAELRDFISMVKDDVAKWEKAGRKLAE